MRALGAPRAHVLHARALRRHAALPHSTRPDPGPLCIAEPRTSRPLLHGISGALLRRWPRPWRHAGVGSGFRRGRRRPNHQRTPAAPEHRPCLSSRSSERVRRRHDALQLQESGRRRSYPRPPREPASSAYLKGPRAQPITQATPGHPHSPPTASNQRESPFFLVSGQLGRRRNPVPFVATGASPANPTPPRVSP